MVLYLANDGEALLYGLQGRVPRGQDGQPLLQAGVDLPHERLARAHQDRPSLCVVLRLASHPTRTTHEYDGSKGESQENKKHNENKEG